MTLRRLDFPFVCVVVGAPFERRTFFQEGISQNTMAIVQCVATVENIKSYCEYLLPFLIGYCSMLSKTLVHKSIFEKKKTRAL